jgi:hypothetical protein
MDTAHTGGTTSCHLGSEVHDRSLAYVQSCKRGESVAVEGASEATQAKLLISNGILECQRLETVHELSGIYQKALCLESRLGLKTGKSDKRSAEKLPVPNRAPDARQTVRMVDDAIENRECRRASLEEKITEAIQGRDPEPCHPKPH